MDQNGVGDRAILDSVNAEPNGTAANAVTADELLAAATDAIAAASAGGFPMRLLGGIAVLELADSARRPPLQRAYHDFDVVVPQKAGASAARIFRDLGYGEDQHFNALHGAQRMIFSSDRGFVVDVLVGTFQMCHRLELGRDLPETGLTVHPADLVLTKLQIVQIEDKDLRDAAALLADLPPGPGPEPGPLIDPDRFARTLAADWGFYHTVELNLPKVVAYAADHLDEPRAASVARTAASLSKAMQAAPKSVKWKVRAKVGEKVTWYELPEEV